MAEALPFGDRLKKMIANYVDLTVDGSHILCIPCDRRYVFRRRRECKRHLDSKVHQQNVTGTVKKEEFWFDLCIMFCACSLSWNVVDNVHFRRFFAKYVADFPLPTSHSLRKTYLPKTYQRVMGNIKDDIRNKFLWLTVDETTDVCGNKVVNVVIRILGVSDISPPIVIASKRILQTTAGSIETVVRRALSSVDVENDNVLMLVTDAAAYMVKAGQSLKDRYPNMIHVTCLAHALHRAAEEVRKQYPLVDSLIENTKEIFIKASSRKQSFKRQFPNVPLPPRPVTKWWCTWIQAAVYFAKYFENVKTFVLQLEASDSHATQQSQWIFQQPDIYKNLCDIETNFQILTAAITKLETSILHVVDTLSVIVDVQKKLDTLTDSKSVAVNNTFKSVLLENTGYKQMCEIHENNVHGASSSVHVNYFEFAPLTSVDVERSFSFYNQMYRPIRSRLSRGNVERLLVVATYAKAMQTVGVSK